MSEIKTIFLEIGKQDYTCECGCKVFMELKGKNVVCPKCALYLIENGKNKVNAKRYKIKQYVKEGI